MLLTILLATNTFAQKPDQIVVWSIGQFNPSGITTSCDNLKNDWRAKRIELSNKRAVRKLYKAFKNEHNLKMDTIAVGQSARMNISFMCRGRVIMEVCWGKFYRVRIEGKTYIYNSKIEDALQRAKIIHAIAHD